MKVADEKKLFDLPDARKLHTRSIASLGGVGIFIGFFLAMLISVSSRDIPEFQYFFAAAIVIFFLGLKDDILIISATKKFLGQLAATAILVHQASFRIESMHGFLGIYQLAEPLGILLSYITIIVTINAFNLIDGVDGLAGSLGVLTTSVFGFYFLFSNLPAYALLSFAMAGSLFAFLIFNYNPAKIFMGDSGSLLLGLTNAILVIKFIAVADGPSVQFPVVSTAAIAFSILIVPLLDTLRVFSVRIYAGRSPFSPDRNHIHHLLLDRGLSHSQVTLSCLALNMAFIVFCYWGRVLGPTILMIAMVFAFFMLIGLIHLVKPSSKLAVARSFQPQSDTPLHPTTKVVSINTETAAAEK
jgi:UDP-N-acetylmuramyl pentapeptide phosphotransferase/UDP-N-acetylglucosamine-1-phosphate transferase